MKLWYKVVSVVAGIAGVTTVIPAPASRPCLLGYYAHCSYTPYRTLICLAIAGFLYWIGKRRSRGIVPQGPPISHYCPESPSITSYGKRPTSQRARVISSRLLEPINGVHVIRLSTPQTIH